jgi:hypothetical protein
MHDPVFGFSDQAAGQSLTQTSSRAELPALGSGVDFDEANFFRHHRVGGDGAATRRAYAMAANTNTDTRSACGRPAEPSPAAWQCHDLAAMDNPANVELV